MVLFCLAILFITPASWALSDVDVVQSSMNHYPKVIQAVLKVEEVEQKNRSARGSFDAKFKGEVDARTQGFYDGDYYKGQLEKPIPYFNSKIYGGLRQSYNRFPVYEGKLDTGPEGETFIGVSLSLLRDSLIDETRGKIRQLDQESEITRLALEQTKINVQTLAVQTYWDWVVKGYALKVYQEILALAEQRAGQIARRVKAGDLAKIYLAENDQYIQKRQAQVEKSQVSFLEASFFLGLFYRDPQGRPKSLGFSDLPELESFNFLNDVPEQGLIGKALQKNPLLKQLDLEMQQAEIERRLGTNAILPKVDVNFEWNQDQGTLPSSSLAGDEHRVMLNVEVPLEYRKGLGRRSAAQAKIEQVKNETQLSKEKVRAKVKSLVAKRRTYAKVYQISKKQIELAKTLAKAEMRKFTRGASDLILVNLREENLGEAQINNLESLLQFKVIESEIRRETVDFM